MEQWKMWRHRSKMGRTMMRGCVALGTLMVLLVLGKMAVGLSTPDTGRASPDPGRPAALSWQTDPPRPGHFVQSATDGFGDRHNSYAWSMQWWKGYLYVGTNRAWKCTTYAAMLPGLYPPPDPDVQCPEDPTDLPLQAEIWRLDAETRTWERVYQSPNDVPIPGTPGKFTARDIGFRDMVVFREPDGTEALYVAGVSARVLYSDVLTMPPPRILRSTDGVHFEPIPQDPGTVLGDLTAEGFRSMVVYKGRLYVTAGNLMGDGVLLEAENPAGGNDNFRQVTPEGMRVFEMAPFNDHLYLGLHDPTNGYAVVKMAVTGVPTYTFTTVITQGGYLRPLTSKRVRSMYPFQGRLYVGTETPAELVRINPDDTWDLIVGTPRETPDGFKEPLSGMDAGFDFFLNAYIWRLQSHNGWLYVGTEDFSTVFRSVPILGEVLAPYLGFDLFATPNGRDFYTVTYTGFGQIFDTGVRTFASTPYGLYLGTANGYYGTNIWRKVFGEVQPLFIPLVQTLGSTQTSGLRGFDMPQVGEPSTASRVPVGPLTVDSREDVAVLTWGYPSQAARFRVFRSAFTLHRHLQVAGVESDTWLPGPFVEVGSTDRPFFVDLTVDQGKWYHYYVRAEDATGRVLGTSNVVRWPSLAPRVTFARLRDFLLEGAGSRSGRTGDPLVTSGGVTVAAAGDVSAILLAVESAAEHVRRGELAEALAQLEQLQRRVRHDRRAIPEGWRREDLSTLLARMAQRVRLVQAGVLSPSDLW